MGAANASSAISAATSRSLTGKPFTRHTHGIIRNIRDGLQTSSLLCSWNSSTNCLVHGRGCHYDAVGVNMRLRPTLSNASDPMGLDLFQVLPIAMPFESMKLLHHGWCSLACLRVQAHELNPSPHRNPLSPLDKYRCG